MPSKTAGRATELSSLRIQLTLPLGRLYRRSWWFDLFGGVRVEIVNTTSTGDTKASPGLGAYVVAYPKLEQAAPSVSSRAGEPFYTEQDA